MSGVHLRAFLSDLRRRLRPGATAVPDGRLLERFVAARDESAFELLVWRHGGMVLNVCRRLLFHEHDVEDAFQATFLVLLRKSATIAEQASVAAWLYRVAYRVALRARKNALKRQRREVASGALESASLASFGAALGDLGDLGDRSPCRELRPVLDHELNRLPGRYREALVLCYLQGKTNQEAAAELGCPVGTVFSRLARGRELLRARLVRRGLTPAASALAIWLAQDASASPDALLLADTLRLGLAAVDGVALSPSILNLTEGVIQAMFVKKLCAASTAALAMVLGLSTMALLANGPGAAAEEEEVAQPVAQQQVAQQVAQGAQAPQGKVGGGQGKAKAEPKAENSVAGSAPVVVKTEPQAGDTQVDAAVVKEIRVTFSKDMNEKGYSFSQISSEHFPKSTAKASFIDKRTCVLPVKLEPGKAYVVWLNPQKFQGFRDADGRPAAFYPLVFETKP